MLSLARICKAAHHFRRLQIYVEVMLDLSPQGKREYLVIPFAWQQLEETQLADKQTYFLEKAHFYYLPLIWMPVKYGSVVAEQYTGLASLLQIRSRVTTADGGPECKTFIRHGRQSQFNQTLD